MPSAKQQHVFLVFLLFVAEIDKAIYPKWKLYCNKILFDIHESKRNKPFVIVKVMKSGGNLDLFKKNGTKKCMTVRFNTFLGFLRLSLSKTNRWQLACTQHCLN